jgi:hypothetical protein
MEMRVPRFEIDGKIWRHDSSVVGKNP